MEQGKLVKHRVIMTGLGGKGVLMAGELLAKAAMSQYEHIVWSPGYASAKRGGPCECTVILSEDAIACPVLPEAEVVVVFEPSQLKSFEERAKPGGLLIIESTGLKDEVERNDVSVMQIPAVEMALNLGNIQSANLILLGAYIEMTKAVPAELIEREIEKRFIGKESLLALNILALKEGMRQAAESGEKIWQKAR